MARAIFELKSKVYADVDATNNPQMRLFDYSKLITTDEVTQSDARVVSLTSGNNTITLPASTCNFIYLETDQTVKLKFNGSSEAVVDVSPSAPGVSDGWCSKRGTFTSLTINVPGTDSANITLWLGV